MSSELCPMKGQTPQFVTLILVPFSSSRTTQTWLCSHNYKLWLSFAVLREILKLCSKAYQLCSWGLCHWTLESTPDHLPGPVFDAAFLSDVSPPGGWRVVLHLSSSRRGPSERQTALEEVTWKSIECLSRHLPRDILGLPDWERTSSGRF